MQIANAFNTDDLRARFPPIVTVADVATLLRVSRKTVYVWIAMGRLDGTFRKRGKHHLFWRDRLLDTIFNGPDWGSHDGENQDAS